MEEKRFKKNIDFSRFEATTSAHIIFITRFFHFYPNMPWFWTSVHPSFLKCCTFRGRGQDKSDLVLLSTYNPTLEWRMSVFTKKNPIKKTFFFSKKFSFISSNIKKIASPKIKNPVRLWWCKTYIVRLSVQ